MLKILNKKRNLKGEKIEHLQIRREARMSRRRGRRREWRKWTSERA